MLQCGAWKNVCVPPVATSLKFPLQAISDIALRYVVRNIEARRENVPRLRLSVLTVARRLNELHGWQSNRNVLAERSTARLSVVTTQSVVVRANDELNGWRLNAPPAAKPLRFRRSERAKGRSTARRIARVETRTLAAAVVVTRRRVGSMRVDMSMSTFRPRSDRRAMHAKPIGWYIVWSWVRSWGERLRDTKPSTTSTAIGLTIARRIFSCEPAGTARAVSFGAGSVVHTTSNTSNWQT